MLYPIVAQMKIQNKEELAERQIGSGIILCKLFFKNIYNVHVQCELIFYVMAKEQKDLET